VSLGGRGKARGGGRVSLCTVREVLVEGRALLGLVEEVLNER